MVLIDGKPCKSCVQELKNLEGKSIVTVEGLSAREKDVYSYSFSVSGAVQCGFCTPGTVISAKALLDREKDPTRKDVKNAIKNNICRCTGYKKIEDAVLLAAKMFREDLPSRKIITQEEWVRMSCARMPLQSPGNGPVCCGYQNRRDDIRFSAQLNIRGRS